MLLKYVYNILKTFTSNVVKLISPSPDIFLKADKCLVIMKFCHQAVRKKYYQNKQY